MDHDSWSLRHDNWTQRLLFDNSDPEKCYNETESWKIFVIVSIAWYFEIFYTVIWKIAQPKFKNLFWAIFKLCVAAMSLSVSRYASTTASITAIFGIFENLHYCIHIFWDDIWSCVEWSRYGCSFICNKRRFDKRLGHLSRNTCLTRS